jgi:hypothetical protein
MSSAIAPTRQRSRLFVDRRLQGGIVLRIVLHWLAFVAVGTLLGATLRWLTHPTEPLSIQIREIFAAFGPYLVAMLALVPIFVLDTIKLTNRFAGPYVRFRRHIRQLLNNQSPGPIKFRTGDLWCETEDDLNALLSSLGKPTLPPEGDLEPVPATASAEAGGPQ